MRRSWPEAENSGEVSRVMRQERVWGGVREIDKGRGHTVHASECLLSVPSFSAEHVDHH